MVVKRRCSQELPPGTPGEYGGTLPDGTPLPCSRSYAARMQQLWQRSAPDGLLRGGPWSHGGPPFIPPLGHL
ncbi:hypothetical protein SAMN00120144_4391, partial [Hymenobacter roseosalivarius DSM 11622]